jgi:DNA-binding CsgD family transcriptional regulator
MRIYSHDVVTRLIGRIYDAVLDQKEWAAFLDELGGVVDGHGLSLSLIDPSRSSVVYGVYARCDPTFVADYRRYYSTIDPWVEEGTKRNLFRPGLVALGEPIVPPSVLKRTEFYDDFGRHYQFCGGVSGLFTVEQSLMAVSFCQYKFGQFDSSEVQLVAALVPHLERAMKIYQRLEGADLASHRVSAVLDRMNCGVLLISAAGKVLFANQTASALLRARDGISLSHGELNATTPAHAVKLREAVAAALRIRDGILTSGRQEVVLPRPSYGRPLSLVVTPLPRRAPLFDDLDRAAVAMFITDPERSVSPRVEMIRLMLRLTEGEARLAQRLALGETLKEAADHLSIRLETARKRLKVIFQKTDTHRQSDLVRLLLLCIPTGSSPD